ncbi:MAG: hypothetical protein CBE07_001425 [Pelagibacteraceae bacterium TMED247]|nr:MAG: hypothetical protein CBE07_001425 [Pelagibacteraceae bacterium TMED247]
MIKELIKLATHLDRKGLHKEADYVDALIKKAGAAEKECGEKWESLASENLEMTREEFEDGLKSCMKEKLGWNYSSGRAERAASEIWRNKVYYGRNKTEAKNYAKKINTNQYTVYDVALELKDDKYPNDKRRRYFILHELGEMGYFQDNEYGDYDILELVDGKL